MEITVIDNYIHITKAGTKILKISLNKNGVWEDLPFNPATYKLDETHPLSLELRVWEVNNYPILQFPNWQGLTTALRGTELFAKTYAVAKDNSKVALPFNLLTSTLNSANPSLQDLEFALTDIKTEMGEGLTQNDLGFVNQVLADNYFPITL